MKHRKKTPRAHPTPPAATSPKTARLAPAITIGVLTFASAIVLAVWLAPMPHAGHEAGAAASAASAHGSAWSVGMLRPDGLRIVVSGRDDASKVLDAGQFSAERVRRGYRIAARIPAVLNRLYCWCGCENRGEHRSNLQCFEDRMAEHCEVCLGTAEIARDMTRKGITDAAQIQAAVDVHWGPGR
jgi:hypothetical protein